MYGRRVVAWMWSVADDPVALERIAMLAIALVGFAITVELVRAAFRATRPR